MTNSNSTNNNPDSVDVVVVGAGFAGLYALHRLKKLGFSVAVVEAASDVGGTWFWNRYPGARCDVTIIDYSYQFSSELQQEWEWSEKYATQPELLKYINHVADRFDLRKHITFNTRVDGAKYSEVNNTWSVRTDTGVTLTSRFCIFAAGNLSEPLRPDYPGFEDFAGEVYYTSRWPHEGVDFTGKRVGVIGTGSSAIQCIPLIAQEAKQLTVFQRTPNYCIPAHNKALDPAFVAEVKANYGEIREFNNGQFAAANFGDSLPSGKEASAEERQTLLDQKWATGGLSIMFAFEDQLLDEESNVLVADYVRGKIREQVNDPEVAELLCPTYAIGTKRVCVDTNYYTTYNRNNVTLVDIKSDPITHLTSTSVATKDSNHEFDCLVIATGFDAMTGTLNKISIEGRNGELLQNKWSSGAKLYLGLAAAGFPNLFVVTGPGSPIAFVNNLTAIEQSVEWITDAIAFTHETQAAFIEATDAAETAWVNEVNELAEDSLMVNTDSWYMGANVKGKPRVLLSYLGGYPAYLEKCDAVVANDYEGFVVAR
jgi:cation diffusion facilitator CzcD-associated flavoprotein CzcO